MEYQMGTYFAKFFVKMIGLVYFCNCATLSSSHFLFVKFALSKCQVSSPRCKIVDSTSQVLHGELHIAQSPTPHCQIIKLALGVLHYSHCQLVKSTSFCRVPFSTCLPSVLIYLQGYLPTYLYIPTQVMKFKHTNINCQHNSSTQSRMQAPILVQYHVFFFKLFHP